MNPRHTITPEVLREMRDWLKDVCNVTPAAIDELSDYQVLRVVELRFMGGIIGFIDAAYPAEVQS